ncbi:MAG TPA: nuclease-related domain-containing protein [Candidatus Limnocylindrales bacterium]|nr:nuclease-related domain-containing protein [Candidatus Limnocylindrales bacterium]
MRKMKGSGNYLKNQVRKNLAKAILCVALFCLIFFSVSLSVLLHLSLSIFDLVGVLLSLVPLAAFYYYLRKYRIYRGGWAGEEQVTNLLSRTLSDDYLLLNGLYLRDGGGDIDHIVLGPNGVFVLETKNWSGTITCNGDEWQRGGRHSFRNSPSLQLKRNVAKIKHIIDSSRSLSSLGVRVEGILVFTNNHATLQLKDPTVVILKLAKLPNYITTQRNPSDLSSQQVEAIGKEINPQAKRLM